MNHYICTGICKGVSDLPKKCDDKLCPMFDHQLEICDCADDKHYGKQNTRTHELKAE